MWAEAIRPPLGGVPILKWAAAFFAALVAAFLCLMMIAPAAHAADATWENGGIRYDNRSYQGPREIAANSPLGIEEGSQYFESREGNTVRIIYFPKDTDINEATGAQFVQYQFSSPNTYARDGTAQTISIDKRSEVDDGAAEPREEGTTSCAVDGIGYILCPFMGFIADAMDSIFNYLRNILEVRPLTSDKSSGLYRAWSIMLAVANVAFIVALLVVVYSYLTEMGLKQHDIRYMLPRLIIAAVLVNVSYYICAGLVDISNIIGANLQDLLMGIREDIATDASANELEGLGWGEITAYILSGGTIAAAGIAHLSAVGGGVIYMLVPILVIAATAIFVTVAVLAARQALITILIIIAPLAFVAFVLPGTQKYFDRWRGIFQTMLLMYPIFSILFGGSQLAGYLIAQNAERPEVILLAMFVQAAPLIITPFLIKFSGGLLGKFAGMVNNPAKGLGDRAKNWASGKQDLAKARRLANNSFGSGLARRLDDSRRRDEALKKRYETRRNRKFGRSRMGRELAVGQMREDDQMAATDNLNKAAYEELKRTNPEVNFEAVKVKMAEMEVNVQKAKMDTFLEEIQSSDGIKFHANNVAARALGGRLHSLAQEQQIQASRHSVASDAHKVDFANALVDSEALKTQAAGIGGEAEKMLATARATQAIRDDFGKGAAAAKELSKHFQLNSDDIHQLALNRGAVTGRDLSGRTFEFDSAKSVEMWDAMVERDMKENNYAGVEELIMKSGDSSFAPVRATIKDQIVANGVAGKAVFVGGQTIDIVGRGGINGEVDLNREVARTVGKGKVDSETFAVNDADAIKRILQVVTSVESGDMASVGLMGSAHRGTRLSLTSEMPDLYNNAYKALTSPQTKSRIKPAARKHLIELARRSGKDMTPIYNDD